MGTNYNPQIVTSGLTMVLDAQNPKSYTYGENLVTYSQAIGGTNWTSGGASLTSSTEVAPDGSLTASLFTTNGVNLNTEYTYQTGISVVPFTTYTFSFYAKLGTLLSSEWLFALYSPTQSIYIALDTPTGVTLSTTTWQRVSYTFTIPEGCTNLRIYPFRSTQLGTNIRTFYVWGAQLEKNAKVSKYTPTTSTAVTTASYWNDATGNTANKLIKYTAVNGSAAAGNSVTYNSNTSNSFAYFDFTNLLSIVGSDIGTVGNTFGFQCSSVPVPLVGSFTISTFIQRSNQKLGGRENIFGNGGGADGWRFGIDNVGHPYYLISGAGAVGYQEGNLGTAIVTDNNWHLLTIVYDRAAQLGSYTVYAYIDTTLNGTATITAGAAGNVAFTPNVPGIGVGGCCAPFAGNMAYLSTYNRALSADEIKQNYNALRGRFGI